MKPFGPVDTRKKEMVQTQSFTPAGRQSIHPTTSSATRLFTALGIKETQRIVLVSATEGIIVPLLRNKSFAP